MTFQRIRLGQKGEDLAISYLMEKGYQILERNVRGQRGEIDIIARDGDTVCFVEVKTRTTGLRGQPSEAISNNKKRKMIYLALSYLKANGWEEPRARFDVVTVLFNDNSRPVIELFQNAFGVDG